MTIMRRRRTGHEELEGLGVKSKAVFEAYTSNAGKVVNGFLEGALGGTVAAMTNFADGEMIGIHAALGTIWTAFALKNFAEAGNEYLHKREEDVENLGIEILTYAKLRAEKATTSPEGLQEVLRDGTSQPTALDFTRETNEKLALALQRVITGVESDSVAAQIEQFTEALNSDSTEKLKKFFTEELKKFFKEVSEMPNKKLLLASAAAGAAATTGGIATMAIATASNAAGAFNAGVALAGAGAVVTSVSGGLLNASASKARSISTRLLEAVTALNCSEFGLDKTAETRSEVVKEFCTTEPDARVVNPAIKRLSTQNAQHSV